MEENQRTKIYAVENYNPAFIIKYTMHPMSDKLSYCLLLLLLLLLLL
jgi:hypothetical protein